MALSTWTKLAEERIAQAIKDGEMDNIPGQGEPLKLEDDSGVPEELRIAYKVLKNAGFTPPELDARNELIRAEELLVNAPDEQARYQALKRVNYLAMKLGTLRPGSALLEEHSYSHKVLDKLTSPKTKNDCGE